MCNCDLSVSSIRVEDRHPAAAALSRPLLDEVSSISSKAEVGPDCGNKAGPLAKVACSPPAGHIAVVARKPEAEGSPMLSSIVPLILSRTPD